MFQHNEIVAQKAIRFLLIFQLIELIPLVILMLTGYRALAFVIASFTIIAIVGVLGWMYYRFQSHPLVIEKQSLTKQKTNLQSQIQLEQKRIDSSQQKRNTLLQSEQNEIIATLKAIQGSHIQTGLNGFRLADAQISGIGPKLKEHMAARAIVTAAQVNRNSISSVDGLGDKKTQAILTWRNNIYTQLDKTKPTALTTEQTDQIKAKYKLQHVANDEEESNARATKLDVDNDLASLLPRLESFAPITFRNYLLGAMSATRLGAGIMAAILVITTIGICMVTGVGALVSSIPIATSMPTLDIASIYTSSVQTAFAQLIETIPATATPVYTNFPPSPTIIAFPTSAFSIAASTTPVVNAPTQCYPGDQIPYVYSPDRLKVISDCIHVTGYVDDVRKEADGDLHILLKLDPEYANLLKPANVNELGDLVVEPVCVNTPTQADAIDDCKNDPDPLQTLPFKGQYIWMEGRYVTDTDHGGWAEIHPLGRWGVANQIQSTQVYATSTLAIFSTATITGMRVRVGALCKDGTGSTATGRGACSHHGGVSCWRYSDQTCTNP